MVQIFIAGAVAFLVAIFVTPLLIRYFNRRAMGQEIREDGPKSHARKRGTPTMGGIAILLAITLGYVASGLWSMFTGHRVFSATGLIVLGLTLALGAVGFADDGMKLFFKRNLGLNKTAKLVAQLGIALAFGLLVLQFPDENGQTPASTNLSFVRDMNTINFAAVGGVVGVIMFLVFIYFLLAAWSNAVNLTDGLDGLAAGTTSLVMAAYTGVTFWQFRNSCSAAPGPGCYDVRNPSTWRCWLRPASAPAWAFCGGTPPREDLHGRYWIARAWWFGRGPVGDLQDGAAHGYHRLGVRHGGRLCGDPGRVVQGDRQARVPHGAVPPPL